MKITNIKEASKFLNIPKNEIFDFWEYDNGDWAYINKHKYYCNLFRKINDEWIELTEKVNALCVSSDDNGDWYYIDYNRNYYKFNKNNELIKKLKL